MLQLPRGLGEQENPGRRKPPDLAFMSSPGSQLYAGESMWVVPPPLPSILCPRGVLTHQLARLCLIYPPPATTGSHARPGEPLGLSTGCNGLRSAHTLVQQLPAQGLWGPPLTSFQKREAAWGAASS